VLSRSAFAGGRVAGPMLAMELELVTLTETSAVFTWYTGDPSAPDALGRPAPVAADTELLVGTSPLNLKPVVQSSASTAYHYAEVTGLEPGRPYFYLARSAGQPAVPAVSSLGNPAGTSTSAPGVFGFTTPLPPPGRHLLTLALTNDLHVGEGTSGIAANGLPPGLQQLPGRPPYPEVMATSMVQDARSRGARMLLVAGDVTSEAEPKDLARARQLLDGFGELGEDYLVCRGNHDRPHTGSPYSHCTPTERGNDCFADGFAEGTTWFRRDYHGLRILGLDTYDKSGNGGDNGIMGPEQYAWLQAQLADEPDRPTLVLGHHPVTVESSVTGVPPVTFTLDQQQGQQLEQLYARTPGVFLHHAGHTHRNKRTLSPVARDVVFQEVAATKEYPGGFTLLRIHEGGYALNFYKTRSELSREWSARTRQEYGGLYPSYTLGTVLDRNSVVQRDFSGLAKHGKGKGKGPH
jgi:hypothetical protein